jgi:hypothetical protein
VCQERVAEEVRRQHVLGATQNERRMLRPRVKKNQQFGGRPLGRYRNE